MHYGDPKHLKEAILQIVVYKHTDLTVKHIEELFDYRICSIYSCKHIDMYILIDFWDTFDIVFKKELKKLKEEKFYLVTLTMGKKKLKWVSQTEVTDKMMKQDPLLGLHL